jgi:hypothetical protein
MDYEKKYKEALERAKEIIECSKSSESKEVRMVLSFFPELKNEDEKIRKDIIEAVELHKDFTQERKEHIYAWLEKKTEQKPAEWSEEDEDCIKQLIILCENCMVQDDGAKKCANWLKSLKDKYTWKPSDEQMDALRYVTNFDYGGYKATLVSLYEQLKKLKG